MGPTTGGCRPLPEPALQPLQAKTPPQQSLNPARRIQTLTQLIPHISDQYLNGNSMENGGHPRRCRSGGEPPAARQGGSRQQRAARLPPQTSTYTQCRPYRLHTDNLCKLILGLGQWVEGCQCPGCDLALPARCGRAWAQARAPVAPRQRDLTEIWPRRRDRQPWFPALLTCVSRPSEFMSCMPCAVSQLCALLSGRECVFRSGFQCCLAPGSPRARLRMARSQLCVTLIPRS